jgi:DNA-3-methyladenine glycosylase I
VAWGELPDDRRMTAPDHHRCTWAQGDDALMVRYHDEEWGVPQHDPRMLWEMLVLEGFQAGLSWRTVLHKREAFRKAFAGFAPEKVAHFGERQVARLLGDPGIIRSRAKIEATIEAARIYCRMSEAGDDFADFCWSFTGGKVLVGDGRQVAASTPKSEEVSKELKRRGFKFVGPVIVHAWMQAVGIVNDHSLGCFRRNSHAGD